MLEEDKTPENFEIFGRHSVTAEAPLENRSKPKLLIKVRVQYLICHITYQMIGLK